MTGCVVCGGWLEALWHAFGILQANNSAAGMAEPTEKGGEFSQCLEFLLTWGPSPGKAGPLTQGSGVAVWV